MRNQYKILSEKYGLIETADFEDYADLKKFKNRAEFIEFYTNKLVLAPTFEAFAEIVRDIYYLQNPRRGLKSTTFAIALSTFVANAPDKIYPQIQGVACDSLADAYAILYDSIKERETFKVDTSEHVKISQECWDKWQTELKEYLKAKDIYKQGTQDTGGDWNISGLTESKIPYLFSRNQQDSLAIENVWRNNGLTPTLGKHAIEKIIEEFLAWLNNKLGLEEPESADEEGHDEQPYYHIEDWFNNEVYGYIYAYQISKEAAKEKTLALLDTYIKEWGDLKKAVEIYKQGTQATGGDWDISGLTESTWAPAKYFSVTKLVANWTCSKHFLTWLYLKLTNDPQFDNGHWSMFPEELDEVPEKIDYYYNYHFTEILDSKATTRQQEIIVQTSAHRSWSQTYLLIKNKLPKLWKRTEIYLTDYIKNEYKLYLASPEGKDCLNSLDIYKQATQDTGGDWNIGGLEESEEKTHEQNRIELILENILAANTFDEFLKLVKSLPDTNNSYNGKRLKNILEEFITQKVGPISPYWWKLKTPQDNLIVAIYHVIEMSKLLSKSYLHNDAALMSKKDAEINFNKWLEFRKAQDAYKQGTQATGGDWDISGLT